MLESGNKMERKRNVILDTAERVVRNISISVNLTIYSIQLIYLLYAIKNGVGIRTLNIALAAVTALFMVVYFIMRMIGRRGKEIKFMKRSYKTVKLISSTLTTLTTVYTIITATDSSSPIAIVISLIGAMFLAVRILVELIAFGIRRRVNKVKKYLKDRFKKPDKAEPEYEAEEDTFEEAPPKAGWFKKKKHHAEDIVIPEDMEGEEGCYIILDEEATK